MSSLSISYLTGIVLASCGAFGAVYVGNMIFPIKGAFGDFKFDDTNRNKIKEWLKPFFEKRAKQDDLVTENISPDTEQPLTAREEMNTSDADIREEVENREKKSNQIDTDAENFKQQREEQLQNRQSGGAESSMVDDATNFLTVPLDKWTEIGENVGIIYTKFNKIRKVCHTQTDIKQRTALIKLCNLMAQKYDLIIQEIERKLSANEKLIKYEQIFLDAYNILEALHTKDSKEVCSNFVKHYLEQNNIKPGSKVGQAVIDQLLEESKEAGMSVEEILECIKQQNITVEKMPDEIEAEKKDEAETDAKINTMFDGGRRRRARG